MNPTKFSHPGFDVGGQTECAYEARLSKDPDMFSAMSELSIDGSIDDDFAVVPSDTETDKAYDFYVWFWLSDDVTAYHEFVSEKRTLIVGCPSDAVEYTDHDYSDPADHAFTVYIR